MPTCDKFFYWIYYYFIHLFDLNIDKIHVHVLSCYLLVLTYATKIIYTKRCNNNYIMIKIYIFFSTQVVTPLPILPFTTYNPICSDCLFVLFRYGRNILRKWRIRCCILDLWKLLGTNDMNPTTDHVHVPEGPSIRSKVKKIQGPIHCIFKS